MTGQAQVSRYTYAGLAVVTMATLMYEMLLTRIFSVTIWYHFAFLVISLAMFGMTIGALIVYLRPDTFTRDRAKQQLAGSALGFAVSLVATFLIHLGIPVEIDASPSGLVSLAGTYLVVSIPFVFSGVCVCIALTRFPEQVGRLYAVDLLGAASGCLAVVYVLDVTDGPTAVIASGLLAALGASCFAAEVPRGRLRSVSFACVLVLAAATVAQGTLAADGRPLVRLTWSKHGPVRGALLHEKWNSFSRVTVHGDPHVRTPPAGWGLSPRCQQRPVRQLWLFIDAAAGTVITANNGNNDGNAREIEHLKCDVTNLAHALRPGSDVLVMGAGGGRDVLSALAFGQRSVVGVELNENILEMVNGRLGEFTGHLDRDPRVRFVNDEARSWLARQSDRFDIIQASLVDTWAATAAGAYVLSEHTLYTVEAWTTFLDHLSPQGLLTVSHWYEETGQRFYRFVSLAAEALEAVGVSDPRPHLLIARTDHIGTRNVATILVSRVPFTSEDVKAFEQAVRLRGFQLVLTPATASDPNLERMASATDRERFAADFEHNVTAPTDDSPFFFHTGRMSDVVSGLLRGDASAQTGPVFVLVALMVTVVSLTLGFIILPLAIATRRGTLTGAAPLMLFFGGIGLGFMLIEVSQLQRLIVFLGHPIYGLAVVLLTLLTAGGLGSYLTDTVDLGRTARPALTRLAVLLGVAVLFGALTPVVVDAFRESTTPVRIAVAASMLGFLGVPMGMCFPLGMKLASRRSEALTPWLWGINGATSVCASVFAVAIATSAGIAAAFWTGVGCYTIAVIAFVWASRAGSS